MLRRRLITGPILILVLLGLGWLDGVVASNTGRPGVVLAALAAAVLIPLAAWEAASMFRATGTRISIPVAVVSAELVYLLLLSAAQLATSSHAAGLAAVGPGVCLLLAFAAVLRDRRIEGGFTAVAATLAVAVWTGLLIGFWVLTAQTVGAPMTAGLILVVKAEIGRAHV